MEQAELSVISSNRPDQRNLHHRFVIKAAAIALTRYPDINVSFIGSPVRRHDADMDDDG